MTGDMANMDRYSQDQRNNQSERIGRIFGLPDAGMKISRDGWVERRVKVNLWEPEDGGELAAFPTSEWGDPLLNRDDAAKLAGSLRTLQRWERKELIAPEGEIYTGGVRTRLFRRSDVVRVRDEMKAKVGRPKGAREEGEQHD